MRIEATGVSAGLMLLSVACGGESASAGSNQGALLGTQGGGGAAAGGVAAAPDLNSSTSSAGVGVASAAGAVSPSSEQAGSTGISAAGATGLSTGGGGAANGVTGQVAAAGEASAPPAAGGTVGSGGVPASTAGAGVAVLPVASGGAATAGAASNEPSGTAGETPSDSAGAAGAAPEPAGTGGAPTGDMTAAGAGGESNLEAAGAAGQGSSNVGSSTEPCGAAGLTFCSDFEADTIPSELVFYPEYQRENIDNFVSVDSTAANSGSRSLKFVGSEFSQMLGVSTGASTFWGRVYLMSDSDIQSGHNTYVEATDSDGDPNNGEHIRIGEHQCQLEVNRKTGDAELLSNGGTYECSGGFVMTANTWYCLEFLYDGPGSDLQVFVDGAELPELNADWGPYEYSMFKFGFEKYHGDAKNLWFDDLALGSERIGCLQQ